jgi:mRNA-degrading endonuclease RelE of RelBE toxin-antitoxin system
MSYRIQIQPEAGTLLRTLPPHTVLRLGRALADLADSIESGESPEESELRVDDCVLQFVVNHAHRLVEVVHVEQRDDAQTPYAAAATTV